MNNQTTAPQWRQATADDLGAIDAIGNGVHLSLPERLEVFAEKLGLSPPGCRVLIHSGEIVGYGMSHPWHLNKIPPLDTFLKALRKNDTHASTSDPDSRLYRKAAGREAKLSYMGHAIMENRHGLALAGMVTHANGNAERRAAQGHEQSCWSSYHGRCGQGL